MKRFLLIPLLCLLLHVTAFSQTDSCRLRVSLLTCSPGAELYSTFGHTALRVTDSVRGVDMVFNYGTFDDRDPDFYVNFTKGLMRYALSSYSYQDFLMEYHEEQRGVIEQVLALNCVAKQQLYAALLENRQEQNRYYYYYFHTDNCTTRARDMIVQKAGAAITLNNILPEKVPSFRNLIHTYLDKGGQDWSKMGIDFLLGANLDDKVTNQGAMFLPDYLMMGMSKATNAGQPLVSQQQTVLAPTSKPSFPLINPLLLFSTLFVITGLLSFSTHKWAQKTLTVFDCVFFLFVGFIGLLIVTLWTIRIDTVCRNNFNLWWALPTHFVAAFVVYFKWNWLQQYFRFVFILTLLFAFGFWFVPQQFNTAVYPIAGIILLRSYFRGNVSNMRKK